MTDFLSLVLAIFVADALFEVTKLFVTYLTRSRQRRDARGRFAPVRHGAARSPRT
jgi:hypothetical protein